MQLGRISHHLNMLYRNLSFVVLLVLCGAERGKEGASDGGQVVYCKDMSNPENNGP